MYNKKTRIYQTIKSLIILFIKLQFSIKCNQAFKLLHISMTNIFLNLNLNPNGLITYIIPNIFVSSWYICIIPICLMIPDIYLAEVSMHSIKSGLGLRIHQAWKSLVYLPKGLYHSSQCSDIHRRQSWRLYKREVLAASNKAFIYTANKGCLSVIHPITQRVDILQEG